MVAIGPHRAAAAEQAVHRPRDTHAERRVVDLDEEMQVIALDGEVHEPKAVPRAPGERAADVGEDPPGAQPRGLGAHAHRDVERVTVGVRRSRSVGNPAPAFFGRPAPSRLPPHDEVTGRSSC